MNYVVVLNHNDQPTDLNGVTAGKYGVLVSNGKTYLPDKPSGDNAHNGANNAANGANNASASHGGTASTGSSIAVIIAMVIVLLIAGSGMLLRIHSPHERTLNRQETSA